MGPSLNLSEDLASSQDYQGGQSWVFLSPASHPCSSALHDLVLLCSSKNSTVSRLNVSHKEEEF